MLYSSALLSWKVIEDEVETRTKILSLRTAGRLQLGVPSLQDPRLSSGYGIQG